MTLPRNEYSRACARKSGRLRARVAGCKGVRWQMANGEYTDWLIDDPQDWVHQAGENRDLAYRWRSAWWCSENTGCHLTAGKLTLRVALMDVKLSAAVVSFMVCAAIGVYLLMAFGAWVLV